MMRAIKILRYIFLAAGILVMMLGLKDYRNVASLEGEGILIQGKIHSKPVLNTGKGRSSYNLVIDYRPEGNKIYRKEFTVSKDIFESKNVSDNIEIKYLKDEPTVSGLSGHIYEQKYPLIVGIGAFLLGIFLFVAMSNSVLKRLFPDKRHNN